MFHTSDCLRLLNTLTQKLTKGESRNVKKTVTATESTNKSGIARKNGTKVSLFRLRFAYQSMQCQLMLIFLGDVSSRKNSSNFAEIVRDASGV